MNFDIVRRNGPSQPSGHAAGVSDSPLDIGTACPLSQFREGSMVFLCQAIMEVQPEPRQVCRRPFRLSYAATAGASSIA